MAQGPFVVQQPPKHLVITRRAHPEVLGDSPILRLGVQPPRALELENTSVALRQHVRSVSRGYDRTGDFATSAVSEPLDRLQSGAIPFGRVVFHHVSECRTITVHMAATRTSRIELRTDPDRERRIRYAAQLEQRSVSAFVLDAAADRAEQVIASAAGTVVPSDFFDEFWEALDATPAASPALERRAASDRRVDQR